MPWGIKVRLAHTERDCILHLTHNIKKFPDAGGLYRRYFFIQRISHGVINILSSFDVSAMTVP